MRLDYRKTYPEAVRAMLGLEGAVHESTLEPELLELVKMRVSQLNRCAYCLDMHAKDARARGESEQRLHVLAAWREAPFFSERERAALAWCEALTLAIVAINGWNRFAVGFRAEVGGYVSPLAGTEQPAR